MTAHNPCVSRLICLRQLTRYALKDKHLTRIVIALCTRLRHRLRLVQSNQIANRLLKYLQFSMGKKPLKLCIPIAVLVKRNRLTRVNSLSDLISNKGSVKWQFCSQLFRKSPVHITRSLKTYLARSHSLTSGCS